MTREDAAALNRIIGLDVSGELFYFRISKLLESGSTFFASLLISRHGRWDHTKASYHDTQGRSMYFLERSPDLFRHVRDYILTGTLHLPSGNHIMALRRALRMEAVFLGLLGMMEQLEVCYSFSPSRSNRGVFYWLGTDRNTSPYQNPYALGAIHVGGWVDGLDDDDEEEDGFEPDEDTQLAKVAGSAASREAFVHYRQRLPITTAGKDNNDAVDSYWSLDSQSRLLYCDHGSKRHAVQIDLKSISLRPTHYSLRVSKCYGMQGDWNFEGSTDGSFQWDILHAARNDNTLFIPSEDRIKHAVASSLSELSKEKRTDERATDILLGILEQDYRYTWQLDPAPTKFYQHFRIIGATEDGHHHHAPGDPNGEEMASEDEFGTCLHGEGLELFGDVCED
jgi:BTB/POZ domain